MAFRLKYHPSQMTLYGIYFYKKDLEEKLRICLRTTPVNISAVMYDGFENLKINF